MSNNKNNKRILELDTLRGFALIGIILTNVIAIWGLPAPDNNQEAYYMKLIDFFVESKFFAIFSFLFGVGFYIFMRNAKNKKLNTKMLFIRRIFILAILGLLHQILQPGEALLLYAIASIFLIPCFYLKKHINFMIGIILLICCLYMGNKTILPIPYFVLGFAAGQFNLFNRLKMNSLVMVGIISGISAIISWILLNKFYILPNYKLMGDNPVKETINEYIQLRDLYDHLIILTSPLIALFYVTLLLLLLKVPLINKILIPLQLYGKMALTNYIGQTLLIYCSILLLSSYKVSHIDTLWICIVIYVIQFVFTFIWLKYFKYGPLEYIWRLGTYWKLFRITIK